MIYEFFPLTTSLVFRVYLKHSLTPRPTYDGSQNDILNINATSFRCMQIKFSMELFLQLTWSCSVARSIVNAVRMIKNFSNDPFSRNFQVTTWFDSVLAASIDESETKSILILDDFPFHFIAANCNLFRIDSALINLRVAIRVITKSIN